MFWLHGCATPGVRLVQAKASSLLQLMLAVKSRKPGFIFNQPTSGIDATVIVLVPPQKQQRWQVYFIILPSVIALVLVSPPSHFVLDLRWSRPDRKKTDTLPSPSSTHLIDSAILSCSGETRVPQSRRSSLGARRRMRSCHGTLCRSHGRRLKERRHRLTLLCQGDLHRHVDSLRR